jgi:hypothetical protein
VLLVDCGSLFDFLAVSAVRCKRAAQSGKNRQMPIGSSRSRVLLGLHLIMLQFYCTALARLESQLDLFRRNAVRCKHTARAGENRLQAD